MLALAKVSLFVLLAACTVGEVSTGGGVDAAPNPNEASFTATITPLVNPKCTGCHGGGTAPNLSSYTKYSANPKYTQKPGNTNILVTKGDHAGITYFDATQKTTIENWINGLQ